jgi:N-acetylglucosamine-6-sulfatase
MKGLGAHINPEVNENGKRSQIDGYLTEVLNNRAVRFLEKKRDKPFCLLLSHKAVNPDESLNPDGSVDLNSQVFPPAERHRNLYANSVSIPRRQNYLKVPVDKPALQRRVGGLPPLSPATGPEDEVIKNRLRMLASVDDGVGEILDTLKRSGKLDNTFFVFASDHGFFYGEHCLSNTRRLAYEESIHVPMLIRYPRLIRPGKRESRFVLGIDLAPTILELAGAPVPRWMHGRSLLPLLADSGHEWRKAFLIEYFSDRKMRRIDHMGYQAIRTERWKYIHYTELKEMDELYDLAADPYEMRNLVADAGASQVRKDLRVQLNNLLAESTSRM